MSDRDSLMAAIIADPADDLPRLAFADWCEENGDEDRHRYIRFWLDVGGDDMVVRPGNGGPLWNAGRLREGSDYRLVVLGDGLDQWERTYCRGFVRDIRLPLADWMEHGKRICARHPAERVEITDKWPASIGGGSSWAKPSLPGQPGGSMFLPAPLWELLPGDPMPAEDRLWNWKNYSCKREAEDALSSACLAFARAETLSTESAQ